MEPTEHDIQNTLISYLWMKGYYAMRLNSGKIPMEGKFGRRMISLSPPGTPDIMAFKPLYNEEIRKTSPKGLVKILFIEVKRPGNTPTVLQEAKIKELEEFGANCFVASSIEDVEAAIK